MRGKIVASAGSINANLAVRHESQVGVSAGQRGVMPMNSEIYDVLNTWSTEEILHVCAFEKSQYSFEGVAALEQLLRERGVAEAEIAAYRAAGLRRARVDAVCQACDLDLTLDRADLEAGEFTCPECGERQFVKYPRMARSEPGGEYEEVAASGVEETEETETAGEPEAGLEPAEIDIKKHPEAEVSECGKCGADLTAVGVYSHQGQFLCAACFEKAVSEAPAVVPVEEEVSSEEETEAEEEEAVVDLDEAAEAETGVDEREMVEEVEESDSQPAGGAIEAETNNDRVGIRGGLLVLMVNLVLIFGMQLFEMLMLELYRDSTMMVFGLGHLATVGFLIWQLAACKRSFKLNFFLYLTMLALLFLALTLLNPPLDSGARMQDYPLFSLMRQIVIIIVWAFYFTKSDRPELTLVK